MLAAITITVMASKRQRRFSPRGILRLQNWLSPAFPAGSYSYSHGIEWAVETGHIRDRPTLVDWLRADLFHGPGRNEAIFFQEAWRCTTKNDHKRLLDISELATRFRGTSEFLLESSQPAGACLTVFARVWPHRTLEALAADLRARQIQPTLAVVLGVRFASEGIPLDLALPAVLQSYIANLVIAGVRLIPLGQTEGQLAIAELEDAVQAASVRGMTNTIDDLGSAAFMVELASMAHETQYTRLFRS